MQKPRLTVIEMKYGDTALDNIQKHIEDIEDFVANEEIIRSFQAEMIGLYNQKKALGLIKDGSWKSIGGFSDEILQYIFLFVGQNLANKSFKEKVLGQINKADRHNNVEIMIASGLGIYDDNVFLLSEWET